jgi:hypothetical protein
MDVILPVTNRVISFLASRLDVGGEDPVDANLLVCPKHWLHTMINGSVKTQCLLGLTHVSVQKNADHD